LTGPRPAERVAGMAETRAHLCDERWIGPGGERMHELKTVQPHLADVRSGRKTFEARRDDRGFREGDLLCLREWTGSRYIGEPVTVRVTYILRNAAFFGLQPGYVVLGIERTTRADADMGRVAHGAPPWALTGEGGARG